MSPCRSARSTRTSTSSRSRSARWLVGGRGTSSRRPHASARVPSPGSSTRARRPPTAAPASTTSGPACSRTSTPASRPCAASDVAPQGRLGLPRPAGRGRGREGARASRPSTRSRPSASPSSTSAAGSRSRATSRTGRRSPSRSACGSTPTDAYWTLSQRVHRERVVAVPPDVGQGPASTRATRSSPYCGRCGTALSSHELGQPGATSDVADPSVYVRFPIAARAADVDLLVWTTTPWTLVSNVAAAVGPDIAYVRVRGAGRRARPGARRGRRRAAASATTGEIVARFAGTRARRLALRAPVRPSCRSTPTGRARGRRRLRDRSTTARASCTSRPRSARTTARSAGAEGLPVLNPVDADGAFDATGAAAAPAGS